MKIKKATIFILCLCTVGPILASSSNTDNESSKNLANYIKSVTLSSIKKVTNSHISDPVIINIKNNQMTTMPLSSTNINRVFVKNDPIVNVNAPSARLSIKNDDSGSVYINVFGQKPFTAYIQTKKHRHFSLLIIPKDQPGRTIEIKSASKYIKNQVTHHMRARRFEYESSYEKSMVRILKTTMTHNIPRGYVVANSKSLDQKIFKVPEYIFNNQVRESLVEGLLGGDYAVRIISAKNNSNKNIFLEEYNFYSKGVRAISIGSHVLPPDHSTLIYEVVDNV